jgi:hypothetical protein
MNKIIFRFNSGFGNRLCNLMNMFYIHEKLPNSLIYIDWIVNNHCNIKIEDIIDLKMYDFILSYDKHYDKTPSNISSQVWANTSAVNKTKWDDIDEWKNHQTIVSVSFHLYSFVTTDYCRHIFNNVIIFCDTINESVSNKINKYGCGNKIIHFRGGDLIKILSENESEDKVNNIIKKIEKIKNNENGVILQEYNEFIVNRNHDDMLDSISDLIYLSKYNTISGYCPYSHFSSWLFLLSSSFINDQDTYPIFNYTVIDIILL